MHPSKVETMLVIKVLYNSENVHLYKSSIVMLGVYFWVHFPWIKGAKPEDIKQINVANSTFAVLL